MVNVPTKKLHNSNNNNKNNSLTVKFLLPLVVLHSAKLLMQMAERMSEDGFLQAGYQYLAVDDCWMASTRSPVDGRLMADPVRFPNGMKHVIDYVGFQIFSH